MKTTSILLIFTVTILSLSLNGCFNGSIMPTKGNGNIVVKEISIADYEKIEIKGSGNLVYEQKKGAPSYLRVEVDENILPLLKIESQANKTLSIENRNINPSRYNIYTNSPALLELVNKGSASIKLPGLLESESLKLSIAGSGNIENDIISCASLVASISGSGNMKLRGKAATASYDVAGSGNIDALDLESNSSTSKIAGSGSVLTFTQNHLNAAIAGSGHVKYRGNPEIATSVAGSGRVERLNN